ncbi:MAG: hypothetical protein JST04_05675 [Bdellovibrionales bacterium]|nr:hypothetical protein [Bdellovibrionales bacterium]
MKSILFALTVLASTSAIAGPVDCPTVVESALKNYALADGLAQPRAGVQVVAGVAANKVPIVTYSDAARKVSLEASAGRPGWGWLMVTVGEGSTKTELQIDYDQHCTVGSIVKNFPPEGTTTDGQVSCGVQYCQNLNAGKPFVNPAARYPEFGDGSGNVGGWEVEEVRKMCREAAFVL